MKCNYTKTQGGGTEILQDQRKSHCPVELKILREWKRMILGQECCLVGRVLALQHGGTSTRETVAEKSQVQGHS